MILAGPMLRRVEPTGATVWLALREARKVTVRVFGAEAAGTGSDQRQIGTRNTVPIGTRLHVVAVRTAGQPLAAGKVHFYDVRLDAPGNENTPAAGPGLFDANVVADTPAKARGALLFGAAAIGALVLVIINV